MDWLQFVSSIISSLAWPSVVVILLILLRAQLTSLAQRLTEFTLPGGASATFRAGLETAKSQAVEIAKMQESIAGDVALSDPERDVLSNSREQILQSYETVIHYMKAKIETLPLELRKEPSDFVFHVLDKQEIDTEIYSLFRKLADLSMVARSASPTSIKNDEALEYNRLCKFFMERFQIAFSKWQEEKTK